MKCVLLLVVAFGAVAYSQYPLPYNVPNFPNRNFRPPGPGNIVEGSYTFIDPNGKKQTVRYSSDGQNGFTTVVQQPTEPPKPKTKKKDKKKDDKDDDKNQDSTTTASPDEDGTTEEPKSSDKEDEKEDKKEDPEKNVRYVPVPVYPPVLGSRSAFPSQPPFAPYGNFLPRTPYAFSSGFGFGR
ncbi:uncharacterized protein LOC135124663 [Zophobas morio]|uniref:uncharacterized protein LOC135124663 n=1 Tax=Zophobas morio TaxID=2755281 RepID=UPI003083DABB